MSYLNSRYIQFLVVTIATIVFLYFGYFLHRENFIHLIISFTVIFLAYIFLLKSNISHNNLFKIGLFFRIVFIFSIPFLSQDFYRFIWDGRLILAGINPYNFLPNVYIHQVTHIAQADFLVQKMGSLSASHYSNYPPINQILFFLAALFSGKSIFGSVLIFRILIVLADVGIYYFGKKLLRNFKQNENKIFFYFLNPLVIVELTGNLHFEGVMLFFLIISLYFLSKRFYIQAACFFAISISIKLLPLILLPIFFKYLGFKKSIIFYSLIIFLTCIFFIPFASANFLSNYIETISLWFVNFEFNASIYYIIREIGFYAKGYNIIHTFGQVMPVISVLIILLIAFFKNNKTLITVVINMMLVLTCYLFLSTTVHPWYIINLVLLSVFTNYKFPLYWSFLVIFSYFAYSSSLFKENLLLIFVEYILVAIIFIVEIDMYKKQKSL